MIQELFLLSMSHMPSMNNVKTLTDTHMYVCWTARGKTHSSADCTNTQCHVSNVRKAVFRQCEAVSSRTPSSEAPLELTGVHLGGF